ncbi:unnamed protein product [marine sediment metagenome]|uniref:Recombination endonuclease VII n=1 Tax=marine sediment metagenome TaxID=412755 RepID=X0ZHY1_9ZZZZ
MGEKIKICSKCKQNKFISDFGVQNDRKSGRRSACKDCDAITQKKRRKENPDKYIKATRRWQLQNPDKVRNAKLIRTFGITLEQYNEMFNEQNGCCVICGKHQSELKLSLAVDHNHDGGNIRQLLCNHCNLILGLVQDNISLLEEFIKYVKKHKDI